MFYYFSFLSFTSATLCQYGQVVPKMQVALEGTSPKIFCNSTTTPSWSRNGVKIEPSTGGPFYILFSKVLAVDSGAYFCRGTYYNNVTFTDSSRLFVGGKHNCSSHKILSEHSKLAS